MIQAFRGFHGLFLQQNKHMHTVNPLTPKNQNSRKKQNFILQNIEKQNVPWKCTAEEVSFECHTIGFRPQTQKVRG